MQNIIIALIWAAFIIVTAFVMRSAGIGETASFTVTMALCGAALATMKFRKRAAKC
ncbi:hypothetical protein [Erythrobacter insulae]|uniref:hypothetical protein n=1 Tax=Erythrobacter insulae TaxID=2584124 RepID=UPI00163D734E|nr:hypothetical protein [Erythrobacter insulae]